MNANPLPPSAKDLAILEHRFRLADMEHPFNQALFELASEQLAREGASQLWHKKSSGGNQGEQLAPLDPVNIVQMEVKLPSMPTVLSELQAVTSNPDASAMAVGEVIARDTSLTAWVLKLVNSPFFGFSTKVDTVTRAVTLMGVQQIKTLAIGGMLQNLMVRLPDGVLNLDDFWRHSIATALAAQGIWKILGKEEAERLFVAGLLHDCGVLALAYTAPEVAKGLTQAVHAADKPRHLVEQELISFDHARLGGMLLHRWNMPLSLVMAVLRHHQVENPERYLEACVVHVADIIAFAVTGNHDYDLVPPLDPVVWNILKLSPANINFVVDGIREKIGEMISALRA
ncbi:HDOD domain-containing protein [Desulfovibrio sp. OttesenSCG-928-C14]|nr:HDOD domain-containing protein [Desulfovibrio sp. OttesenSCG-928-C14]